MSSWRNLNLAPLSIFSQKDSQLTVKYLGDLSGELLEDVKNPSDTRACLKFFVRFSGAAAGCGDDTQSAIVCRTRLLSAVANLREQFVETQHPNGI